MLEEKIYRAGIKWRNPLIEHKFCFLLESQGWNGRKIAEWQYEQCRSLLLHAYQKCPFYKKLFDKVSFDPKKFESIEQLSQIPPISKLEVRNSASLIQNYLPHEKHFYSETSGSSGSPLVFYRNASWDAWHRASVFRGYSWHGVSPWERNGYLWGYNFSFSKKLRVKILDMMQNRFRLFSYNESEIACFIKKLERAEYLRGYSSMIYEIAKHVNQMRSGNKIDLRMILGTSEKIFDSYQKEVRQAFGKKIISEYGSAEAGIIAFECAHGAQHLNMETVIVEVEEGEIIVTNLVSHSFPFIRYKLGDLIRLDLNESCHCGMRHITLREVLGRVGRIIHGKSQNYPSLTLYYVFKNLAMEYNIILNYQGRQNVKGYLQIFIEQKIDNKIRNVLLKELRKYYSDDINLEIHDKAQLKSTKGKRMDFISSID